MWAKHFHANVTIFEKDNQSCLFCFTAFTLSAIQVFIMKQNGVWNIILEAGGGKEAWVKYWRTTRTAFS